MAYILEYVDRRKIYYCLEIDEQTFAPVYIDIKYFIVEKLHCMIDDMNNYMKSFLVDPKRCEGCSEQDLAEKISNTKNKHDCTLPTNQSFRLLDLKEFLISNTIINPQNPKLIIPLKCNLDLIAKDYRYIIDNQERIMAKLNDCVKNISQTSSKSCFDKAESLACIKNDVSNEEELEEHGDDFVEDNSLYMEHNSFATLIVKCLMARKPNLIISKTANEQKHEILAEQEHKTDMLAEKEHRT
ncbi:hypothetical protein RF11_04397 [Thelohanellus kitauei]|uniref:Uncharacterized protein n=1 Tax=Thelohanellus kitauei TaxID=669202 RepID=A0A0C2NLZ5_THEKT|nr:hypothetical protein RF11_04397 [Thelohanellus kitauei]